jgi:hypothetical protein
MPVLEDYFRKLEVQGKEHNVSKVTAIHEAGHAFAHIYFRLPSV